MEDTSVNVKVAVNIRPLIKHELLAGCSSCITVTPGEPQVQLGSHAFTFDYVFPSIESPSHDIFDVCVAPLVEALFSGYNATVLAYGQTGSGKTYTMGADYTGGHDIEGIIPKVMEMIFQKVEASYNKTKFLIRVSFIEIYNEEIVDLLNSSAINSSKVGGKSFMKPVLPKNHLQIRGAKSGEINLSGVTEPEVQSKEEMARFLACGALARAKGGTNMNSQSSRSHAIFTISIQQNKASNSLDSRGSVDGASETFFGAKLHLVDLAGSERVKSTGADGLRLKEGIHINKGLLTLGNVISALGDDTKSKGTHVPYRDSKLTHLLQDSIGGNSKTIIIACVSPADRNVEETLNTLRYANRARNIQNKPIINRDPVEDRIQRMQGQLEQLQTKLLFNLGEGSLFDEFQILKHKVSVVEESTIAIRRELLESKSCFEHFAQSAIDSQVLQRETEEACTAAKRLKEPLEAKEASPQDIGAGNGNGFTVQDAIQSIEHELEAVVRVHEGRRKYNRIMEERAAWAEELAQLKEEAEVFKQKHIGLACAPRARSSRIFALESMLKMSSETLNILQLYAAAESEENFNINGRWNGVRSLADAQSLLNILFELVSSSRCQLRDMELAIEEKDYAIKELKEKVVELPSMIRKPEEVWDTKGKSIMLLEGPRIRSKKKSGDQMIPTVVVAFSDIDVTDPDQLKTTDIQCEQSGSELELSSYNYFHLGRKRACKCEALPQGSKKKSPKSVCCSCTRYSCCKRNCECLSAGRFCGSSCGCWPNKCTNREPGNAKDAIDAFIKQVNLGHRQQKQRNKCGKQTGVQLIRAAPRRPH